MQWPKLTRVEYWHVTSVIAGLAVIITVVLAPKLGSNAQRLLVAAWLVLPPVFFFAEYHLARQERTPAELTRIRESQELARGIWAGIAAALAIMYLKSGPS
jgi:hypothetical protein